MRPFLLVFFLVLFGYPETNAQGIIIEGRITEVSGIGLAGVNIMLLNPCKDSTILVFGISDAKGNFKIHYQNTSTCKQFVLSFTAINYKRNIQPISNSKGEITFDVVLETQAITLKEVIVKPVVKGFKQISDTTVFNLSQYSDGTERKLEDILKKLPGITVAENGVISFKGKSIDRILVEGDDFFSKNYTLLSKNVSADLIDKIEALENFHNEKLLKGITPSDKIALNLKLKKDLKLALFGEATTGLGLSNKYNSSLNLFSFVKKVKVALLGNMNNTGTSTLGDIQYNFAGGNDDMTSLEGSATIQNPIDVKMPSNLDISQNRYLQNRTFTGGLQFNFDIAKDLKVRFYTYLNTDKQEQSLLKKTNFYLPDTVFFINEKYGYRFQPFFIHSNLRLSYQPTASQSLTYNLSVDRNIYKLNSNILLSDKKLNGVNHIINGNSYENSREFRSEVTYVKKLSENRALIAEFNVVKNNRPTFLTLDTNRFSFISIPADWQLHQELKTNLKTFSGKLQYVGKVKHHTYSGALGFLNNQSALSTFYFGELQNSKTEKLSFNDISLKKNIFFAEILDNIVWKQKELTGNVRVIRNNSKSIAQDVELPNKKSHFFLLPGISLKLKPFHYSTVGLNYKKDYSASSVADLYRNGIINNYLNMSIGGEKISYSLKDNFSLSYRYSNTDIQWIMGLTASLQLEEKSYVNKINSHDISFIRSHDLHHSNTHTFFARFQSDKYVSFLKSNWRVTLSAMQNNFNTIINDEPLTENRFNTFSTATSLITSLDIPVNFQAGISLSRSAIHLSEQKITNHFNNYNLSATWKYNKNLYLKPTINTYQWNSLSKSTTATFLDLYLRYAKAGSKWSGNLNIKNLLNANQIDFNVSGDYFFSQSSYQLLKRYALVSFNYNF